MTGNIYLVGFMGSGKSTVGRLLAQTLNRRFVDMDEELEKKFKKPIREVFAQTRRRGVSRERDCSAQGSVRPRPAGGCRRWWCCGSGTESGFHVELGQDGPPGNGSYVVLAKT